MMRSFHRKQGHGMTLVELLVVMGILSVVLMLAFSMLIFNNNMHRRIQTKVDVQASSRFIMNDIEAMVGNATDINLAVDPADTVPSGYWDLYVATDSDGNGRLVYKEGDAVIELPSSSRLIQGLSITYGISSNNSKVIVVHFESANGYELDTDVFVQNYHGVLDIAAYPDKYDCIQLGKPE